MRKKLLPPLQQRFYDNQLNDIDAIALKRGEDRAETIRYLIQKAIDMEKGEDNIDHTLRTVRAAVLESIKPLENRLASIWAKNAITSGTSMYMNLFVLEQATDLDPNEVYELSRKKAVALLKASGEREDKLQP